MTRQILYDNGCSLCSSLIRFVKFIDNQHRFSYVALQSEEGKKLIAMAGLAENDYDTAIYSTKGKYYLRSGAILHIFKDLGGLWSLLYVFIIVPVFLRDWIYRLIARNRHRLFPGEAACEITGDKA